jgi:hypothetical protein
VDKEQRSYLQSLLNEAARSQKRWTMPPRPPAIRAAENLVERWKLKQYTAEHRYLNRVQRAKAKINELILFGDPKKALAAIHEFQSRKF